MCGTQRESKSLVVSVAENTGTHHKNTSEVPLPFLIRDPARSLRAAGCGTTLSPTRFLHGVNPTVQRPVTLGVTAGEDFRLIDGLT